MYSFFLNFKAFGRPGKNQDLRDGSFLKALNVEFRFYQGS